jgi:sarcosine oxidase subunit gamma
VSSNADGSFDLTIRRSFADYIAQWLLDAGKEHGCLIQG